MKTKQEIIDGIISQGMLPLFFHKSKEVTLDVTRTLYKAGIRIIEYTNRGEAALENFKALKHLQKTELPDLLLGIGTIKTPADANSFIEAGADFIIAPIVNPEVAEIAKKHNLVWIPGCMTPTEIYTAQHFGASLIKIFPANILGPAFVSSIKELFPGQLFMPTGGVELTADNISSWFRAGVCAVGMGSKLITKKAMENQEYDQLYNDTLKAIDLVQTSR
ncbi:bifunctional 4-hydroxy-2-oxoglutarate aldolase/2-dehydro-3-deoxy-phosphogluconate aldolase [Mucilaginibacter sp. KACC 22063]|uniref:bifunctional 4-hydroxy-2-oxoglutarate aldolase/2-dehydro-3-deoxy-phosphogluconate aldolase n=1 Tax=Mucilaginibacter sp. KACC 22063 TaxID=3025666 RepID=UPI002366300F|nr:bifunctional 4-hydroxy-2-oxoglutarate aldolase/2-dehydro-3-deoxy-phosphogluconate aldolase [Mucilaginibacter sp. KACC 22063]WDF56735.1 bifunctional 4-hydroxy-2-oxoglutarate aldolase/2-dehydro-3-deoxy-phosphogluconate aldolase [Mucilaginibacter sp. KACC 22063]